MEKVVVVDEKELKKKIKEFKRGGAGKLHILSDFDKTLTKLILPNGDEMPSLISRIRNGHYLSAEYSKKANELYEKYHPIEIDSDTPMAEKKKKMYEWWFKHFELLGKSGLNKEVIQQVVDDLIDGDKIALRKGARDFFKVLGKYNIPLVVISSSVGDLIEEFLKKENLMNKDTYIIANKLEYDRNGKFIDVKEIVYVFNKDETALPEDIHNKVRKRKNVLLLGDSEGDIGMVEGFEYDNLIKVGFLNENIDEDLDKYKEIYDVIIINDGTMEYVNELLNKILNPKPQ